MLCDLSVDLIKSSVFPVLTACKGGFVAASYWLALAVPSVMQLSTTSIDRRNPRFAKTRLSELCEGKERSKATWC